MGMGMGMGPGMAGPFAGGAWGYPSGQAHFGGVYGGPWQQQPPLAAGAQSTFAGDNARLQLLARAVEGLGGVSGHAAASQAAFAGETSAPGQRAQSTQNDGPGENGANEASPEVDSAGPSGSDVGARGSAAAAESAAAASQQQQQQQRPPQAAAGLGIGGSLFPGSSPLAHALATVLSRRSASSWSQPLLPGRSMRYADRVLSHLQVVRQSLRQTREAAQLRQMQQNTGQSGGKGTHGAETRDPLTGWDLSRRPQVVGPAQAKDIVAEREAAGL